MPLSPVTRFRIVAGVFWLMVPVIGGTQSTEPQNPDKYDAESALRRSQAAIGRRLGDYLFTDTRGNKVRLTDYAGKPLLISLVFTSCYHTCPVTTRRLSKAVTAAREALDEDSFKVVTIGFDSANDTPANMQVFAREQNVDIIGWDFLSGPAESIADLTDDLGFIYFPSPRGFDHIVQVTILDRNSVVHTQVYGEMFELPWLVEPLKNLVFNRPQSTGHPWRSLVDRIRIFCTVYDPTTGRYEVDYSFFIQIAIGLMIILTVMTYLLRESRRTKNR